MPVKKPQATIAVDPKARFAVLEKDWNARRALADQAFTYPAQMHSNPNARINPPLPIESFISLFDALGAEIEDRDCDNTLRGTTTWLAGHGYDVASVTRWLERRGGYCDCEVLLNVEPKVRFTIGDV